MKHTVQVAEAPNGRRLVVDFHDRGPRPDSRHTATLRMEEPVAYVPLSVRHGGPRKKLGWWLKCRREAFALWLAPWLRGPR